MGLFLAPAQLNTSFTSQNLSVLYSSRLALSCDITYLLEKTGSKSSLQVVTNEVTGINFPVLLPFLFSSVKKGIVTSSWEYRDHDFLGRHCEMDSNFQGFATL